MKYALQYTAMIFIALSLLTGCGNAEQAADANIAEAVTETTAAASETASAATTTVSQTTTAMTEAATTETTAVATAEIESAHSLELVNADFGTRPAPELYRSVSNISQRVQSAWDEERGMYGDFSQYLLCPEKNCLFAALDFSTDSRDRCFSDFSFYRVDLDTGDIHYICDAENMGNNKVAPEMQDFYGMVCLKGRFLLCTYSGIYLIDDENDQFTPLDTDWNPLAGSVFFRGEKLVWQTTARDKEAGSLNVTFNEYDPESNTVTQLDEMPDFSELTSYEDVAFHTAFQGSATLAGGSGELQTLLLAW